MATNTKPEMDAGNAMEVLAQTSMPLEVGAVEMDADGSLRPRISDHPVAFSFSYYGLNFEARLPMGEDTKLHLTADLGVIPFSVENAFGRKTARSIIRGAKLPNGQLTVDAQSRVHLHMAGTPETPRTPVNVLSTVAALLMEAKPYMELLELSLRRHRRRSNRQIT